MLSEEFEYIFGFGSIINPSTHAPWLSKSDQPDAAQGLPGWPATVLAKFGYERGWNFRSNTGFTALGIQKVDVGSDINGVVFQIERDLLADFDRREVGYNRIQIPAKYIQFTDKGQSFSKRARLWVYVPKPDSNKVADEDHPILQSYVDTVLQGCLFWRHDMAEVLVKSTKLWSPYFLNDTPSSRRPWLYRQQYQVIDNILRKHNSITHFESRRHPEEFASAFLMKSMRGAWSIPRRNVAFTGRDKELSQLHTRLTSQREDSSNFTVATLEVAGMGGVGKTQLCCEYCYRYFPSYYGLVMWIQASSAESVVASYRQLMVDTSGSIDTFPDKSTDEIVTEVKARLFRSTVPWLLVFDNLENPDLLEKFCPHGGSSGHVLITTRLVRTSVSVDSNQSIVLGCFSPQESVELLSRTTGDVNAGRPKQHKAAVQLAEHLGHLPLALGMAAAYMRECDVDCEEYLARYYNERNASPVMARHLGHEAVSGSLSVTLTAIKRDNPVVWAALQLFAWIGPDQITKKLVRALFVSLSAVNTMSPGSRDHRCTSTWISSHHAVILAGALFSLGSFIVDRAHRPKQKMSHEAAIAILAGASVATAATAALPFPSNSAAAATASTSVSSLDLQRSSSFAVNAFEETDITWTTLKSFSLLVVRKGNGSMHRLLAKALRLRQSEEEQLKNLKVCLDALIQSWTFCVDDTETWAESTAVLEHVKTVVSHFVHKAYFSLEVAVLSREVGVFAAMALNRFAEAQTSLEMALRILDGLDHTQKQPSHSSSLTRADCFHELGRVHRYQGDFVKAENCLSLALESRKHLARKDANELAGVAATLHELGVLEIRKHQLDSAAKFLQEALTLRRQRETDSSSGSTEADCASTLHQLATVELARKPPSLDKAESLLSEALSLNMQIGQRAATLKQLARVAIRRGKFTVAESRLSQALGLYFELYGEDALHINVAAVRFQQGTLALQREQYDRAWEYLNDCLRARMLVYSYSQGNHLEVSTVLHQLGLVAFNQRRFELAREKWEAEKERLEQLFETASQQERLMQAVLTNYTWLTKCAREQGDEDEAKRLALARRALKQKTKARSSLRAPSHRNMLVIQGALSARKAARQYALAEAHSKASALVELKQTLVRLNTDLKGQNCAVSTAARAFHECISRLIGKPTIDAARIFQACDNLRVQLREQNISVEDSVK